MSYLKCYDRENVWRDEGDRFSMKYWVERWSELRMKEMIDYPKDFAIHNGYLKMLPEEEARLKSMISCPPLDNKSYLHISTAQFSVS